MDEQRADEFRESSLYAKKHRYMYTSVHIFLAWDIERNENTLKYNIVRYQVLI